LRLAATRDAPPIDRYHDGLEFFSVQGKRAKASVFRGTKAKTTGGLTKDKLTKSKSGRVVSKAASAAGKKNYKRISGWTKACQAPRVL
jgi:hypothetical protein